MHVQSWLKPGVWGVVLGSILTMIVGFGWGGWTTSSTARQMAVKQADTAVTAALVGQVRAGDHVIAAKALFGACRWVVEDFLPRFGVESTLVNGLDLDAWRRAVRPNTKVFFLESPTNPTLEVIDIAAVAKIAHEAGARLVVDNVFATPLWQSPLALGADCVVYSATKHIDGQGRTLAGAILGPKSYYKDNLQPFLRHTGPSCSPFNAWIMLKGLETLDLRVERHCKNAQAVAKFLETQPGVKRVIYPGLKSHPQYELARRQMTLPGSVLSFEIEGGKDRAFRIQDAFEVIDISNNLGDTKSIVTHPATTTHQRLPEEERLRLGISAGLLRLSVGLFLAGYAEFQLLGLSRFGVGDWGGRAADGSVGTAEGFPGGFA